MAAVARAAAKLRSNVNQLPAVSVVVGVRPDQRLQQLRRFRHQGHVHLGHPAKERFESQLVDRARDCRIGERAVLQARQHPRVCIFEKRLGPVPEHPQAVPERTGTMQCQQLVEGYIVGIMEMRTKQRRGIDATARPTHPGICQIVE